MKSPKFLNSKISGVALVALAFTTAGVFGADARTTQIIHQSFDAASGGSLVVDVDTGSISVTTSSEPKVKVELVCKLKGDERNEAELRELLGLKIEQSGGKVTVRARRPFANRWRNIGSFEYKITVPTEFEADLKTSGGGISVAGLTGSLDANTSGGGLHFENITGDIEGRTSGGGIDLTTCVGEVNVHTSGGGITARNGEGPLDVHTSGGGIRVESHNGYVKANTSGGGITARNIAGNLEAETSGGSIDASLLEQPTGDCRLHTSGGGITVRVPSNIAVDIEASASAGSVSSDLPVTVRGKISKDRINGTINGGGPLLALHSSAGSVHIKAR